MTSDPGPILEAYLLAIRSVLAALVLAILALPFLLDDAGLGFWLGLASVFGLAHSVLTVRATKVELRER